MPKKRSKRYEKAAKLEGVWFDPCDECELGHLFVNVETNGIESAFKRERRFAFESTVNDIAADDFAGGVLSGPVSAGGGLLCEVFKGVIIVEVGCFENGLSVCEPF